MTGLIHFMEICREEKLRDQVLSALKRHADAVIARVGPGKTAITETSDFWGGVNSCSILEPFTALYRLTGEERYLRFSEYILSTGGCRDGNLVEIALENRIPPYKYPEVKAYETMSFFEGVLAVYQATGEEKYLRAAMNFFNAVVRTDLTIIGCCGCTDELFDHSAVRQTVMCGNIMQETCVSVTWMRLCARLLLMTGDSRYYAFIERTGYNALYGAVNLYGLPQYDRQSNTVMPALPFDSYSPLTGGRRGVGIGGLKRFSFGGFYGCCACIASAGIALLPLTAVLFSGDGVCVNALFSGRAAFRAPDGKRAALTARSGYPREGRMLLTAETEEGGAEFTLRLRAPDDLRNTEILVNGVKCLRGHGGAARRDPPDTGTRRRQRGFPVRLRRSGPGRGEGRGLRQPRGPARRSGLMENAAAGGGRNGAGAYRPAAGPAAPAADGLRVLREKMGPGKEPGDGVDAGRAGFFSRRRPGEKEREGPVFPETAFGTGRESAAPGVKKARRAKIAKKTGRGHRPGRGADQPRSQKSRASRGREKTTETPYSAASSPPASITRPVSPSVRTIFSFPAAKGRVTGSVSSSHFSWRNASSAPEAASGS